MLLPNLRVKKNMGGNLIMIKLMGVNVKLQGLNLSLIQTQGLK
jgi:hypothetical protein